MSVNASKWKLNKKEEKMVAEEAEQLHEKLLGEGVAKQQAAKRKDEFTKKRSLEIKQQKAQASAARKEAAGKAPETIATAASTTEVQSSAIMAATPVLNNAYFQEIQKAYGVVTSHFKGIESAEPLKITGDAAEQSGCQAGLH